MANSTYRAGDEKLTGLLVFIQEFIKCLEISTSRSRWWIKIQHADDSIKQSIDNLAMHLKDTRTTVEEMKERELDEALQTWNFGLFELATSCVVCFEEVWKNGLDSAVFELGFFYVCKDDVDDLLAGIRGHVAAMKVIIGSIELYESW
jgi:hypothetical protein